MANKSKFIFKDNKRIFDRKNMAMFQISQDTVDYCGLL